MAEVTDCRYDVRAGRALAFGLTSSRHYRITYTYRVGDQLRQGECFSQTARLRGSLFLIQYDPNQLASSPSAGSFRRLPLLVIGLVGTAALAMLLLGLRGC